MNSSVFDVEFAYSRRDRPPATVDSVRPLVAWKEEQKSYILRGYAECWATWQERWWRARAQGAATEAAGIREVRPRKDHGSEPTAEWMFDVGATGSSPGLGRAKGQHADAADCEKLCEAVLIRHLFPDTTRRGVFGPIARAVAQEALSDWLDLLQDWLGFPPQVCGGLNSEQDREGFLAQWSGCLLLSAPWVGGTWHLQLAEPVVRSIVGAQALSHAMPVSSSPAPVLASAILDKALDLHVVLADVPLSLGQLRDLRMGDLVTLPHALEEPAFAMLNGVDAVGRVWLGRQLDHVAVEFLDPDGSHLSPSLSARPGFPARPFSETLP